MSAILRIAVGLVILILTVSIYRKTFTGLQEGGRVLIGGSETGVSPALLTIGFVVAGLIGAWILVLGIVSLLRKAK